MARMQVRQEARTLQGTSLRCGNRTLRISGGSSQAEFEMGSEGLVHLATDEHTHEKFRIKCFWEPHERRQQRSQRLVQLQLPELRKPNADALGGAPFEMLPALGQWTPFAVVMKNVRGENWKKLRSRAEIESQYPTSWWPAPEIRATWGYGLATAVMKMEDQGFIHSDLSPGNVVVNDGLHGVLDHGQTLRAGVTVPDESGDMALVDFDRYVHSPADVPEPGQGSMGYAAPEIWQKQVPLLGSDRFAMAILIQEFLVVGDSEISRAEAFDWSYDQEARLFEWSFENASLPAKSHGEVHPLIDRKYPAVAQLVRDTLAASGPQGRPTPSLWRRALRDIVEPRAKTDKASLPVLWIEADPVQPSSLKIAFSSAHESLDLSKTGFGIRATLWRDPDGTIYLMVHNGAVLNVQAPGSKKWKRYESGSRVNAEIGAVLFDKNGTMNARFVSPR